MIIESHAICTITLNFLRNKMVQEGIINFRSPILAVTGGNMVILYLSERAIILVGKGVKSLTVKSLN